MKSNSKQSKKTGNLNQKTGNLEGLIKISRMIEELDKELKILLSSEK